MKFQISVEQLEAGQRKPYGDSFYHYMIETTLAEWQVKDFCTKFLRPSFPKDEMPNPFAGQLVEFIEIAPGKYSYKVREEYTG